MLFLLLIEVLSIICWELTLFVCVKCVMFKNILLSYLDLVYIGTTDLVDTRKSYVYFKLYDVISNHMFVLLAGLYTIPSSDI